MPETRHIRKPKQKRGIQMKDKILKTALELFCKKGYYRTTTNEIAKTAGVSIGSLYAYFADKDTILLEILEQYHAQFVALHRQSSEEIETYRADKKKWLRTLVESLIKAHEASRAFNQELKVLYHANPAVATMIDKHTKDTLNNIKDHFKLWEKELKVKDPEATAVVTLDFISGMVDRIVFGKGKPGRERILSAGIDALAKYLL